jgi:hypothetical protein
MAFSRIAIVLLKALLALGLVGVLALIIITALEGRL